MCEQMQESGLTEVTPLMCTLSVWGQYPLFSCPGSPRGSPSGQRSFNGLVATILCLQI